MWLPILRSGLCLLPSRVIITRAQLSIPLFAQSELMTQDDSIAVSPPNWINSARIWLSICGADAGIDARVCVCVLGAFTLYDLYVLACHAAAPESDAANLNEKLSCRRCIHSILCKQILANLYASNNAQCQLYILRCYCNQYLSIVPRERQQHNKSIKSTAYWPVSFVYSRTYHTWGKVLADILASLTAI